ncbi:HTH-type transcriptional repressor ComR [Pseudovibrio axinellae]|uniref:HTH-type transcriptional repressor ComR n=1 Tax=Pseudovibrio axinellae TaxID=989403 RepID=A0A165YMZ0_9HYPH|nr:TetR/AcrR family transcriptional regulator [Pseudovibrio axinellae]KZL18999.1 HTH-type transcriptional repressor ComR [Pseudovibrio axinellae]SEP84450.1 transcriptional regulator, TetR family [Pseudovibrio axinellae]
MEKKKAVRGRPRRFDKDEMLQKASELFWKQGYEGTSISDLVGAMGVTPPSLYAAFKSKENLYLLVLDRYADVYGTQMLEGLGAHDDAVKAIKAVLYSCAKVFTASSHPLGCMISTGLVERAESEKALSDNLEGRRSLTIAAIYNKLVSCRSQFLESTDLQSLAAFVGATIQGMSIQAKDGTSEDELRKLADLCVLSLSQFRHETCIS